MSVKDLNAAIAAQAGIKLAIVSQPLFVDLLSAGELTPRIATLQVPRDPDYGDTIDGLIRSMGHDPDAPVPIIYHTLTQSPRVVVHQDIQHGQTLADSGPGAFVLR